MCRCRSSFQDIVLRVTVRTLRIIGALDWNEWLWQMGAVYSDAAASIAPAALKVLELVMTMSTGYLHSINLAQPESLC